MDEQPPTLTTSEAAPSDRDAKLGQNVIVKLSDGVKWSFDQLAAFRKKRYESIIEYVGHRYSEHGSNEPVPVNYIAMIMQIYVRLLAANAPRVMITTKSRELRPMAHALEIAANHLIKEIKLTGTLQAMVQDALLGIGIVKVGLCQGYSSVSIDGVIHNAGQPFAETVDLDDWVHDMTASTIESSQFMGTLIRRSKAELMESGLFDNEMLKKIQPNDSMAQAGMKGETKTSRITQGEPDNVKEFVDTIKIWELYLPAENKLIYLPEKCDSAKPLREEIWNGPEGGPYRVLAYNRVPKNSMPLPPVALWYALHRISNNLMNKLTQQALRQKSVLAVPAGSEEDAKRIINTPDGEGFRVDGSGKCEEVDFGGPNQVNMAMTFQIKDLTNTFGGNFESLGGLGAQTDTVGQEKLITESSSAQIKAMSKITSDVARELITVLVKYIWDDPLISITDAKRVPGTDISIPFTWTPEMRDGDFFDLNIDIDVYSMEDDSPIARNQKIDALITTILPLQPLMLQQGIALNVEGIIRRKAEYMNMADLLDDLFIFMQPQMQGDGTIQAGQPPMKSPVTQRTTVRVNRPAATSAGKDAATMASLLGASKQPAEMAQVGRSA